MYLKSVPAHLHINSMGMLLVAIVVGMPAFFKILRMQEIVGEPVVFKEQRTIVQIEYELHLSLPLAQVFDKSGVVPLRVCVQTYCHHRANCDKAVTVAFEATSSVSKESQNLH